MLAEMKRLLVGKPLLPNEQLAHERLPKRTAFRQFFQSDALSSVAYCHRSNFDCVDVCQSASTRARYANCQLVSPYS
jgi:hypothetical protein